MSTASESALLEVRRLVRPIRVNLDLEGMDVLDGILTLGGRAGPQKDISNVMHELCHFIEIDDKRCTSEGWGLKYGRWVECPVTRQGGYYELTTNAHIKREARVWAFQHNLSKFLGFPSRVSSLVSSVKYLPDFWFWYKGKTEEEKVVEFAAEVKGLTQLPQFQADHAVAELKRKKTFVRALKHI